jgi:acetyl esterase/lipase
MEYLWHDDPPYWDTSAGQSAPTITPYLVPGTDKRTGVLVFPGGGYTIKAPHEGEPIARRLNEAGYHAFVVDYRVAPYRHPVPLCDAQRAVRIVRARAKEWNVDEKSVGILGFSAGGHLCATLSTRFNDDAAGGADNAGRGSAEESVRAASPTGATGPGTDQGDMVDKYSARPDFAVLCYAVISFREFGHSGSMANLLGPDAPWHLRRQLSCELQVSSQTPPTFLWHTADDPVVPVENSLRYAESLRSCGVPFELHVFPTGRHGLGLAQESPEVAQWMDLAIAWIWKYARTC